MINFILFILLFASLGSPTPNASEKPCILSKDLDDSCGANCYPMIKPMLLYFETLQAKEKTCNNLQAQIDKQEVQLKEQDALIQKLYTSIDQISANFI